MVLVRVAVVVIVRVVVVVDVTVLVVEEVVLVLVDVPGPENSKILLSPWSINQRFPEESKAALAG